MTSRDGYKWLPMSAPTEVDSGISNLDKEDDDDNDDDNSNVGDYNINHLCALYCVTACGASSSRLSRWGMVMTETAMVMTAMATMPGSRPGSSRGCRRCLGTRRQIRRGCICTHHPADPAMQRPPDDRV
jgi:hypothetical protein